MDFNQAEIEDLLSRAAKGQIVLTDFLDPAAASLTRDLLRNYPEVNYKVDGGYPNAEKVRFAFYPIYVFPEDVELNLGFIEITGNFKFQAVTHRDFLGAILGTGIKREKVGDLILIPNGCQVVVDRDLVPYLIQQLDKVHRVGVTVKEIVREELLLPEAKTREVVAFVKSLRLDSVGASGFGISRSQMVKEIEGQKVRVNWKLQVKPSYEVAPGDVISLRGRGRVEVLEIAGVSKSGRNKVILRRYL
ncbi:RNA-binding protein [Carboxydothermus hydrogenoformans]|uniref:S4 domain protein n=1 Tax=Carboxydothermus hydrogenoformans (strain ATCC BAA-161 / DSM 6008 / Z-2901) TaxID=246194 RepID=Q3AAH6_CARHZ|nr:YlmH/Sll1252 family protein [Carboxydothermus hydrogenoformans]ABB14768.1 S4 domain protein [Carboxydothermus hydrogenoformans Z-2901]